MKLGISIGYRDPGVAVFGLVNAVLPVGQGFLEEQVTRCRTHHIQHLHAADTLIDQASYQTLAGPLGGHADAVQIGFRIQWLSACLLLSVSSIIQSSRNRLVA